MNVTFAPRATANIGRNLGQTLSDLRWPYIYAGCLVWTIIIAFMTAVWCLIVAGHLAAILLVWYVQLHVWIVAAPFVIVRAIRDRRDEITYLPSTASQEDIDNLRKRLGLWLTLKMVRKFQSQSVVTTQFGHTQKITCVSSTRTRRDSTRTPGTGSSTTAATLKLNCQYKTRSTLRSAVTLTTMTLSMISMTKKISSV